jgi:hypothetical protein
MGMEITVTFANEVVPAWTECRDFLFTRGFPVQMRMIDGELAFPDEVPPDTWRELRIGTSQGMITVRRDHDRIAFITWGNADAAMVQAWNGLIWAFAKLGDGRIEAPVGPRTADEFRAGADLPTALRGET